jgi:hypothetical protein
MRTTESRPYRSAERLTLPIPATQAAALAAELYLPVADRSVQLLRLGTADLGYFSLVSLATEATEGGTQRLVGGFARVHP